MNNKVILISIDGMRPDGLTQCKNPYVEELMGIASYAFDARTVYPPVTLPCHMSMFYSVPPERHGTTTNTYMPQVRPINGLFEQLKNSKKVSCMYYGWEPLRDVSRPESLTRSEYMDLYSGEYTDAILTDRALSYIKTDKPDFVFLYMAETDGKGGHDNGWMSDEYLKVLYHAVDNVKRVIEETNGEYTVIVTADHGGHDRVHGNDIDEDMIIPMFFYGPEFAAGKKLEGVSVLDLAPTIAELMGVSKAKEWEGHSVLCQKAD